MFGKKTHIALIVLVLGLAVAGVIYGPGLARSVFKTDPHAHPGTILKVDNPGGKEAVIDASSLPDEEKFFQVGEKRVPVIRIDVFKGPDGSILEVHEQGPNGQSLRRSYPSLSR